LIFANLSAHSPLVAAADTQKQSTIERPTLFMFFRNMTIFNIFTHTIIHKAGLGASFQYKDGACRFKALEQRILRQCQ
jgi:hypothetical protein